VNFTAKAADIVGLYLNPPEEAIVFSIYDKPNIQALERSTGYVLTSNSKIVRGIKSTYKRHGTLNLFAAFEVATVKSAQNSHRRSGGLSSLNLWISLPQNTRQTNRFTLS
jgi:hypothetical protein